MTAEEKVETRAEDSRWSFIRDVLVLQLKLLLGNVHNLILIPATMIAAALDLVSKGERHGGRFYRVLELGRQADEAIGLYGALARDEEKLKDDFTVDAVVARLEDVVKREYQKGATAAGMKSAVDSVLDQLHRETEKGTVKARAVAEEAVNKLAPPKS